MKDISQSDKCSHLKEWIDLPLGEVADYLNGRGFKKTEWEDVGDPIIRIQNLNDHEAPFNYTSTSFEDRYRVRDGDLLFAWAASLGAYFWHRGDAWLNQHIFKVQPKSFIDKSFLYYTFLRLIDSFYAESHGSGMVHITKGRFEAIEIGIPSHVEQVAIVEKLESLFSELDQGVELLTTIQQQLKRYRQAVLKAAFEGKLTAEWRSQQSGLPCAEELLTQIKAERDERYAEQVVQWEQAVGEWEAAGGKESGDKKPRKPTKPKELPPMSGEELEELPELPEGWAWCRLNQIARLGTGTTPSRSSSAYWDNGTIPWVTSSVVNDEYCSKASEFVSQSGAEAARLQVYPKNTLLLAMYGEGKTRGKVTELLIESSINQALAAICFDGYSDKCRNFVKRYLQRNYIQMRERSAGGVQPNLNVGLVSEMRIPIAPIDEQAKIIEEIDFRLSVFDEMDETVSAGLKKSKALRQSILKMAFEGRLLNEAELTAVRADPAYEPAEKLLERIKTEREQAKAAKPKRKTKAKSKKAPHKSKVAGSKT
tara:strand:+ start:142860 stop:144473 length:1614 start_codon:yes stop_codon:yes gene_type:complete